MPLNFNKFWRIYKLEKEQKNSDLDFRSIEMEQDSTKWEILSTQVFEKDGELFVSVLWKTDD